MTDPTVSLMTYAALLRIPVDTGRLFDGDEDYELAVWSVVERVSEHRREEADRAQRQAGR